MRSLASRWRADFITGLAVVLPAVVTLAIVRWLFGTVSQLTEVLLFFIPRRITHQQNGQGEMYWYWSLGALVLATVLVIIVGRGTRFYVGKRLIRFVDDLLSKVPLLNKIYGTVKQVNEAFYSSKKTAFKQVVLFEYPRRGIYSVAFVTSEEHQEASSKLGRKMVGVFVPTTPNPTSGFLVVVPEDELIPLEMSVADGIKYVISLGSVTPEYKRRVESALLGRTMSLPSGSA
ncbi:MAG: DUF502 domain-containing protein [Verrucomicrobiae bacterium]|nr:DUF502 domain-containing protein [Verrucomicrobiae bacterium]